MLSQVKIFVLHMLLGFKRLALFFGSVVLFRKLPIASVERILVFRTCLLGDFIYSIPALRKLRKKYPTAKIVFLTTSSGSRSIREARDKYVKASEIVPAWFGLVMPSLINDVIAVPSMTITDLSELRGQVASFNACVTIILPHPGESLIPLLKKMLFLRWIGVSKNLHGWDVKGDYQFLRGTQLAEGVLAHKAVGPLRAVREFDPLIPEQIHSQDFAISLDAENYTFASDALISRNPERLLVAVCPGSIQPHKRWPIRHFRAVISSLHSEFPVRFVVLGTQKDLELSNDLISELDDADIINLTGQTDVFQLAAVIKQADVLLTNDGGSAHIGSAVGTKVVSIFSGIEYAGHNDPWGSEDYSVFHEVSCSPCYSMTHCPLGHAKCITELPVERVLASVRRAIAGVYSERGDIV